MNFLNDLTLQQILTRIIAYFLFAAAHGLFLSSFAYALGAREPRHDGRLTLNPLAHLSIWGLVMAVLFRMGWILPMQIDPNKTLGGRWGLVFCALASLAATLALVPLVDFLRPLILAYLPATPAQFITLILVQVQIIVVGSVALNLLPLPLLTGRLFLIAVAPTQQRLIMRLTPLSAGILVTAMLLWLDLALAPRLLEEFRSLY